MSHDIPLPVRFIYGVITQIICVLEFGFCCYVTHHVINYPLRDHTAYELNKESADYTDRHTLICLVCLDIHLLLQILVGFRTYGATDPNSEEEDDNFNYESAGQNEAFQISNVFTDCVQGLKVNHRHGYSCLLFAFVLQIILLLVLFSKEREGTRDFAIVDFWATIAKFCIGVCALYNCCRKRCSGHGLGQGQRESHDEDLNQI